MSQQLDYRIHVKIGTNPTGVAKLCPPLCCVIPYQAIKAAGFEQDLPRNEIKGTMGDHVLR